MQASRTGSRGCTQREALGTYRRRAKSLLQCSRVAGYEVLGGGRMAQGRGKEGVARVALGDDPSSDGAARVGMRPRQPFHVAAIWLYRAEMQPFRVQSPGLFEAAQLRIGGPLEGGDCLQASGQLRIFTGKCMGARAPTWCLPSLFAAHWIDQRPEPVDLHLDGVPVFEEASLRHADARGSSGRDDVSRQ
jgi:hypothetical protein